LFLQEQLKGIIISRLRQLANHRESAAAAKKKIERLTGRKLRHEGLVQIKVVE
jgi:hypothetical protein